MLGRNDEKRTRMSRNVGTLWRMELVKLIGQLMVMRTFKNLGKLRLFVAFYFLFVVFSFLRVAFVCCTCRVCLFACLFICWVCLLLGLHFVWSDPYLIKIWTRSVGGHELCINLLGCFIQKAVSGTVVVPGSTVSKIIQNAYLPCFQLEFCFGWQGNVGKAPVALV